MTGVLQVTGDCVALAKQAAIPACKITTIRSQSQTPYMCDSTHSISGIPSIVYAGMQERIIRQYVPLLLPGAAS